MRGGIPKGVHCVGDATAIFSIPRQKGLRDSRDRTAGVRCIKGKGLQSGQSAGGLYPVRRSHLYHHIQGSPLQSIKLTVTICCKPCSQLPERLSRAYKSAASQEAGFILASRQIWFTTVSYSSLPGPCARAFQYVSPIEKVDEVEPVGLHPAHGTAGHPQGFGVAVIEFIMVAAQFFPGSGKAAHSLAQKSRVCNEAPAHHDARQFRECRFQCPGSSTVVTSPL